ncbi:MAG: NADH-quinone oxidoreductase subunit A [Candidatus Puniceispirillum sp.]|nr:NADH-quinone oxidoreductase subunit A [Candidatus Pelagibacter sp.]MBA4283179.1 NADH-quinone oxidoreductase subunit A [Candidatus Puniceispirillum sp.]
MDLNSYIPIVIFLTLSSFLAIVITGVSWLRSQKKPYAAKNAAYECGFDAFDSPKKNTRKKFNIHFYLVSILFIIFDIEILFLIPFSQSLKNIGWYGFFSVLVFLAVLTFGFIYEWKKGALEWK